MTATVVRGEGTFIPGSNNANNGNNSPSSASRDSFEGKANNLKSMLDEEQGRHAGEAEMMLDIATQMAGG